MLIKLFSGAVNGIEAVTITIEVNILNGAKFIIVGLPDNAIKESLVNSGMVEWLTDVLRWVASLPDKFERGEWGVRLMAAALQILAGVLVATSKAVQNASISFLLFIRINCFTC